MTAYYAPKQVGLTQSLTPEGFLLCKDVPISRTGTLLYAEHELAGLEGLGGVIHVERLPDDVFSEHAINSFAGKPVIITHGAGEITAENWDEAGVVGVVMNPRRGEGDLSNCLVADLLITSKRAIELVRGRSGHEVSAGYNAEYEQIVPGRARQYDIIGNHVALVENGRCGQRCSIGDSAMPMKRVPLRRQRRQTVDTDAIRRAFRTRDEEALERELGTLETEAPDDAQPPMGDDPNDTGGHHITVNIHGAGSAAGPSVDQVTNDQPPAGGAPPAAAPGAAPAGAPAAGGEPVPAWAQGLIDSVAALDARLSALEEGVAGGGEPDGDEGGEPPANDEGADMPPAEEPEDKKPTGDEDGTDEDDKAAMQGMTKDNASLKAMFRDTVARAEILVPGVKLPTMDAKAPAKATFDSLCAFRRQVMAKAVGDEKTNKIISPLVAGRDLKRMTCDSVAVLFTGASELVKAHNTHRATQGFGPRIRDTGPSKVASPAEINKAARELWGG